LARADHPGIAPRSNPSLRLQAEVFVAYSVAALISAFLYARWPSAVAWLAVVAIAAVVFSMRSRSAGK
jgi:hypothetical protein